VSIALELAAVLFLAMRLAVPIAGASPPPASQATAQAALPAPTAERIEAAAPTPTPGNSRPTTPRGTWTLVQRLPPGSYQVEITDQANQTTRRVLQLGAAGAVLTVP
jgi:hypothetical protein